MAKDESGQGKKKGGFLKLILIFLVLMVLLGGAAVALRVFAPGLIPGWGEKAAGGPAKQVMGVMYPLKTIIVNLADPSGKRYLKVSMTLDLSNPAVKAEADEVLPKLHDSILVLLSGKSFGDINTPEGKRRLRQELVNQCNSILSLGEVKGIYFSDFVIQ